MSNSADYKAELAYLKLLFDIKKELKITSPCIPNKTPIINIEWLSRYVDKEIINIICDERYKEYGRLSR